jgi:hypothetical protein
MDSDCPLGISLYPMLWLTTYDERLRDPALDRGGQACDATSQTSVPDFTSMGISGVSQATPHGRFANIADGQLIILYAILLGMGLSDPEIVMYTSKNCLRPIQSDRGRRAGYDFVRASPLFRLVAIPPFFFGSVLYR